MSSDRPDDAVARPLRVAQFIDSMDPGGAEEVVVNLARQLPTKGIEVVIYHLGNPWLAEQVAKHSLKEVVLDASGYKSVLTLPGFCRRFARQLRNDRIDVLHAHLLGAIFAGAVASRLARLPSIGTVHDVYSLYESSMNPRYLRWAQRLGMYLVAVCDAMKQEVERVCRLRPIERIYNGIDLERFSYSPRNEADANPFSLICVARAVDVKRLDLLLDAFALAEPDADIRLMHVGDGPLLDTLRKQAEALGIADRVRFEGQRDDVPDLLTASDAYLLVSDSEGMSVSILESMASGLPAIVTDVGGNRELVEDGVTAAVVAAGDADGIAKAMRRFAGDRSTARRMGRRAREKVEECFSLQAMTANYGALLLRQANV